MVCLSSEMFDVGDKRVLSCDFINIHLPACMQYERVVATKCKHIEKVFSLFVVHRLIEI